ncbi:hypothetical protein N7470_005161 [Penicillium chermesinum]|nr:hypothetical protein N7470_005161 [Penicillium chermesinum]
MLAHHHGLKFASNRGTEKQRPAEVLLGYQPHTYGPGPVEEEIMKETIIENHEQWFRGEEIYLAAQEFHSARLDYVRECVREIRMKKETPALEERTVRHFHIGDLVLLRNVALDQVHGRKFEPKWKGPFRSTSTDREEVNLTGGLAVSPARREVSY